MPYTWTEFTAYLDGTRVLRKEERDELWTALEDLLTRCGGRWSLISADMDEIKASQFITDLTHVEDAGSTVKGDLAKVLIDIQDTFTGTTGYDAFKAVAPDEGLDDAKLAEMITAGGRVIGGPDDYKLWNLYKRVLDYLQCCPTGLPEWEHDSVGRTFTKCGEPEFGTPSNPPEIYLRLDSVLEITTNGGTFTLLNISNNFCVCTSYTYTASAVFTEDYAPRWIEWDPSDCTRTNEGEGFFNTFYLSLTTTQIQAYTGPCPTTEQTDTFPYLTSANNFGVNVSPTVQEWTSPHVLNQGTDRGCDGLGNIEKYVYLVIKQTRTLSIPFTTDALVTKVRAAIAAEGFDGDYDDTPGSFRHLPADQLSYTERPDRARLRLTGFTLVDGITYRIRYLIRFIPLAGPSVDGEETYVEITFATGMTHTPPVDIPVPTENGTNMPITLGWLCAPFAP
ncbi:MAG: hypothetical protein K0R17_3938 [Rariglobus sp.]|jgi:hypothetical protein|nr:hypothetical protein [Rariglobus sp.]